MERNTIIDNTTTLKLYFKQGILEFAPVRHLSISLPAVDYLANALTSFARSEYLFRKYKHGPMERINSLEPLTILARTTANEGNKFIKLKAQLVGDECLFLVSFFYEYLLNKCGEGLLRYHGQLGSGAYQQAAELSTDSQVFSELARNFWDITDVVRNLDQTESNKHKLLERHRKHLIGEEIEFN